jgi:hypothetical protein
VYIVGACLHLQAPGSSCQNKKERKMVSFLAKTFSLILPENNVLFTATFFSIIIYTAFFLKSKNAISTKQTTESLLSFNLEQKEMLDVDCYEQ